jgi:tetratricopeptide (TPR) repeat protein
MISPELIEIFNKAAHLARDGKYEESLAEYDKILDPSKERIDDKERKVALTGEFLGVTMIRKAWVLMDMKRYKDAKALFEDKVLDACLGQLDLPTLYEYFFSYANALGELGDIKAMDDRFSRALGIAAKELNDKAKCFQCWSNLMTYAFKAQAWEYLELESATAKLFAQNVEDQVLQVKAGWHHIVALMELNRYSEAMEEADVMLVYLRGVGADEAIGDIEEMLADMTKKQGASGPANSDNKTAQKKPGSKNKNEGKERSKKKKN